MTIELFRLLDQLQPFSIVWNTQGQIVQVSILLRRIWKLEADSYDGLMSQMKLVRPFEAPFKFEWLSELNDLLTEIRLEGIDTTIKGQFLTVGDEYHVFIASPHLGSHEELTKAGLRLSDLSLHDRLGDLIIANEANRASLHQAREAQQVLSLMIDELKTVNEVVAKFVPHQFLGALGVNSVADARRGLHIGTELSVMFGDMRNFSTLTEGMHPQDVMSLVNHYLSHVSPAVQANGGVIAQYLGDGIMAVFPTSTDLAVAATQAIQRAIRLCSREAFPTQPDRLRMGIGLHFGPVELGIIGDENRWESAVLSDVTNTAARIEGLTKTLGAEVLISEAVYQRMERPEAFEFRRLGAFQVKGRQRQVEIRELMNSLPVPVLERRLKTRTTFEKGVDELAAGNIDDAVLAFGEVCRTDLSDLAAQTLLDRCLSGEAL